MKTDENIEVITTRPFFLTLLCISLFVYSGTISILFIVSLVFKSWIDTVVTDYYSGQILTMNNLLLVRIIGLTLHTLLFISGLLIWKLKRWGLLLMAAVFAFIIISSFIFGIGNWLSTIVYIIITGLFTIYYRIYSI